ncbi:MAG: APC family permease [Acidobacteriota bacterium]
MNGLRRGLRPIPLLATMYVLLCGGPFGTEEIVPSAGPGLAILVMTLMAFLWAAPYALIVAELVTKIPVQGGIWQWFRASLGPFWSFQLTYLDWLTWVLDAALYPPLVAAYLLTEVSRHLDLDLGHGFNWSICLVVIWACTWLNIRGVKEVGRLSLWMAVAQILPVLAIIVLGWEHLRLSNLSPWIPEGESFRTALHAALVWALWNYAGYGALAAASEEIVEPERSYPKVLAGFLPLSMVVYILPLVVALGVTPDWTAWSTGHLDNVAVALGGAVLGGFVVLAAQVSNIGLFNSEQLIISRVPYAMAREGVLPPWLTRLHPRYRTPTVILVLQGVAYSVLTYLFDFRDLLEFSTWLALPTYILTFVTPIILRWRRPELRGSFEIPGGWPVLIVTAAVPTLIALYVLLTVAATHLAWGLGFIALGPVIYALAGADARRRARRHDGV